MAGLRDTFRYLGPVFLFYIVVMSTILPFTRVWEIQFAVRDPFLTFTRVWEHIFARIDPNPRFVI